jgi:hypothetical protein
MRVELGLTGAEVGSTGSVSDANQEVGGEIGCVCVPGTLMMLKDSCAWMLVRCSCEWYAEV